MRDRSAPGTLGLATSGLLLGYARVSTDAQDLTNQREQLAAAGCSRIFAEKVTGTRRDRPELARLLDHLRPGDVVTVTRLDRLARSTRDLLDIAERIQAAGAGLRSLAEPWADTTSPAGRMVLTVFAGIAEFERELIRERTKHGREAAKARGVKFGPRPTLTPAQIEHARELIDRDGRTVKEAAELLAVHRSTLYRALARGEEVTKTEARRRGAFAEDALSEADALAAVDDERQEEGPAFLDGDGPAADLPPPPYRTQSLPQILAALPDDELASWPGELSASQQRPQAEQQAPDALAGFRASVERAEAAGGGLALDVARAQLAVAQEFQAAGKDPRHHAAAIMQEGQRRAFAGLSQPSPAKVERQAERPAAVQVNAVAVGLAKQAVSKFKALAAERRVGSPAMKDRGSKWQSLAPELREQIERFNALPATQQAQAAERMQQEMAERYSRDPKAAARDRELFQGRDRGGLSR